MSTYKYPYCFIYTYLNLSPTSFLTALSMGKVISISVHSNTLVKIPIRPSKLINFAYFFSFSS